jgi:hypothetical protein
MRNKIGNQIKLNQTPKKKNNENDKKKNSNQKNKD